ncbi:auxin-responsive protein SAUR19-like [Rutidosis leptorrhynchoides]|uniref:auxin-responsive protein SAUR19-like n=1 Tax=Rutidosis leptorrhynchoides TaxID=125765 RepID=UPI003A99B225
MHTEITTFITILQDNLRNTVKLSQLSSTFQSSKMAIRMPRIIQAKEILRRSFSNGSNTTTPIDIPKGYFAVYVGEQEKTRFVVPVSLLSQPTFQELLKLAEEEFGYYHPMGGLTIPCSEYIFTDLASRLGAL